MMTVLGPRSYLFNPTRLRVVVKLYDVLRLSVAVGWRRGRIIDHLCQRTITNTSVNCPTDTSPASTHTVPYSFLLASHHTPVWWILLRQRRIFSDYYTWNLRTRKIGLRVWTRRSRRVLLDNCLNYWAWKVIYRCVRRSIEVRGHWDFIARLGLDVSRGEQLLVTNHQRSACIPTIFRLWAVLVVGSIAM